MPLHSIALTAASLILEAMLILRAVSAGSLSKFPLFYSYVAYVFGGASLCTLIFWLGPQVYADVYWVHFLVMTLVEFAVLLEISDHIFSPFPAIRYLGRLLVAAICSGFFLLFILPSILASGPSDVLFLGLVRNSSLTKAVVVVALLVTARYFRIPLSKNVSGIAIGFIIYVSLAMANFAAAGAFGRALYASILSWLNPLSYIFCLLVWTAALWRYEPARAAAQRSSPGSERLPEPLGDQLGRYNATLTKFLEK